MPVRHHRLKRALGCSLLSLYLTSAAGCDPTGRSASRPAAARRSALRPPLQLPADTITDPLGPQAPGVGRVDHRARVLPDGVGELEVPLWLPAGRAKMQPELSLLHRSPGGNGPLGTGWTLTGAGAITRCPKTFAQDGFAAPIRFDAADALCLDGARLALESGTNLQPGAIYRPEADPGTRVTLLTADATGPLRFEARLSDGRIREYGGSNALTGTRLRFAAAGPNQPFAPAPPETVRAQWSLAREADRFDNAVEYTFTTSGDELTGYEHHLSEVRWTQSRAHGADRRVVLTYAPRSDPRDAFVAGFHRAERSLLSRIDVRAPNPSTEAVVRSYALAYVTSATTRRSLLSSVTECDASGHCLPPLTFGYSAGSAGFSAYGSPLSAAQLLASPPSQHPRIARLITGDLDGNGLDDVVVLVEDDDSDGKEGWYVSNTTRASTGELTTSAPRKLPLPHHDKAFDAAAGVQPFDFNLDGRLDFISLHQPEPTDENNLTVFQLTAWRSTGTTVLPVNTLLLPTFALGSPTAAPAASSYVGDFNGDGRTDVAVGIGASQTRFWSLKLNDGTGLVHGAGAGSSLQSDRTVYSADLDGSGHPSLLLRDTTSKRFAAVRWAPSPQAVTDVGLLPGDGWNHIDRTEWFVDVTDDGLPDRVSVAAGGGDPSIEVNTGAGFLAPRTVDYPTAEELPATSALYQGNPLAVPRGIRFVDHDGDGFQDLFWPSAPGGGRIYHLDRATSEPLGLPPTDNASQTASADFDGDGLDDLALVLPSHQVELYVRNGVQADLLTTAGDGLGGVTTFVFEAGAELASYTGSTGCSYPHRCLPAGMTRVRELRVPAGAAGPRVTRYEYQDLRIDVRGRGALGCARFTETVDATGLRTTRDYPLGEYSGTLPLSLGAPSTETTSAIDAQGARVLVKERRQKARTVLATTPPVQVVFEESSEDREHAIAPGGAVLQVSRVTAGRSVDDYGNVLHEWSRTGDGFHEDTYREPDVDTSVWLVGRTRRLAHRFVGPGLDPARVSETCDDGRAKTEDCVHDVEDFTFVPGTPAVETRTRFLGSVGTGDGLALATTYRRSTEGTLEEVTSVADSEPPRTLTIGYDATGIFPASILDAMGHEAQLAFHPALGVVGASADANGLVTRRQYDGYGREVAQYWPSAITTPDLPEVTTLRLRAQPGFGPAGSVFVEQVFNAADGRTNTWVDAARQPLRTERFTLDGAAAWVDTTYDTLGRKISQSAPYRPARAAQRVLTTWEYDAFDRITLERNTRGGEQRTSRLGLTETRTSATGRVTHLRSSMRGWTVSSRDELATGDLETTWRHDPRGNVLETTSPGNVVVRASFDHLGRRVFIDDPDSDAAHSTFNGFDEQTSWTSSLGTSTVQRDALGRVVRLDGPDGATVFVWDTAPNGLGKLARSSGPTGVERELRYDALSRLDSETEHIGGVTLVARRTYDPLGRLDTLTYPGGFVVDYDYASNGRVERVVDRATGAPIWAAVEEDEHRRVAAAKLADGKLVERQLRDRHGDLRFLDVSSSAALLREAYDYTLAGQVAHRHDALHRLTEGFEYDAVDRLSAWTTTDHFATSCQPGRVEYRYDVMSNLTAKQVIGDPRRSIEMFYEQKNGAGPHAISSSTRGKYAYDDAGRQIDGPSRHLEYTSFDLPRRYDAPSGESYELSYDADRKLVHRQSASTETYYLPGVHQLRKVAGQPDESVDLVTVDGVVVAQRRAQRGAVEWDYLHSDRLGSIRLVTSSSGQVRSERRFEPFGELRSAQHPFLMPSRDLFGSAVTLSFTAYEAEESELLNAKGRFYDPVVGRFLSPDPLIADPTSSQAYNRFSYVLNNPISLVDPTGFAPADPEKKKKEAPKPGPRTQTQGTRPAGNGVVKEAHADDRGREPVRNSFSFNSLTYDRPNVTLATRQANEFLAYVAGQRYQLEVVTKGYYPDATGNTPATPQYRSFTLPLTVPVLDPLKVSEVRELDRGAFAQTPKLATSAMVFSDDGLKNRSATEIARTMVHEYGHNALNHFIYLRFSENPEEAYSGFNFQGNLEVRYRDPSGKVQTIDSDQKSIHEAAGRYLGEAFDLYAAQKGWK